MTPNYATLSAFLTAAMKLQPQTNNRPRTVAPSATNISQQAWRTQRNTSIAQRRATDPAFACRYPAWVANRKLAAS